MKYSQSRKPNLNVPTKPGWCLAFVKDAFGLKAVYPSATAAWNASPTKHRDFDFPQNVWVPLWFSMITEPLGHVVLRAPDGTIFSTSDYNNRAKAHHNLSELLAYYAYYGMPLEYLGWTEDIEGQRIMEEIKDVETRADKMLVIARTHDDPTVWIGDGVQRRHIPNEQTVTDYQWGAMNGRLNIFKNGEVQFFDSVESLGQAV